MAKPAAEIPLRRGDRRRRRPRSRDRLLPREGARHGQHRRARKRLAGRWQHGAQHDDRAFELPPRSQRAFLRAVAEVVGGAVAGTQLQRDVQRARRVESRPFSRRHGRRDASWQRDALERHRCAVPVARRDRAPHPESRLLAGRTLPDHGRPLATARRHGASRRGGLGLRTRGGCAWRRHHPAMRSDGHSDRRTARLPASRPRKVSSRRATSASRSRDIRAGSRRWRGFDCRSNRTRCRRW